MLFPREKHDISCFPADRADKRSNQAPFRIITKPSDLPYKPRHLLHLPLSTTCFLCVEPTYFRSRHEGFVVLDLVSWQHVIARRCIYSRPFPKVAGLFFSLLLHPASNLGFKGFNLLLNIFSRTYATSTNSFACSALIYYHQAHCL